jgi:hypothetical protein
LWLQSNKKAYPTLFLGLRHCPLIQAGFSLRTGRSGRNRAVNDEGSDAEIKGFCETAESRNAGGSLPSLLFIFCFLISDGESEPAVSAEKHS